MTGAAWWTTAVGYVVYIRSFADGDGDGIGDLNGLHDRLDYLAWLGVDLLWITPFYPSPMADFGYDVANYTEVDPIFGNLGDFDRMLTRAHDLGIRVIVDVVPNHSSDQHEWFRRALAEPEGPYRDYYHFRDAPADGPLPNNWVGYFGGPVWTLDEASGQYYLHLFLPEQPDLNWANPAVQAEFEAILRFWLDRGIDGFRIDVAQAMAKDPELRSNPELAPVDFTAPRENQWAAFDHKYDVLQPATLEVFRSWKSITDEYGAVLVGETYVLEPAELTGLLDDPLGLDLGFWFKTMHMDWDADSIRSVLAAPEPAVHGKVGWVQASHDEPRPPTRFGGGEVGAERSLALAVLLFGLPGVPFLYQGEELGIDDGEVLPDQKADPVGVDGDVASGRDGCRTPMPWAPGISMGFSTNADPWLPIGRSDSSVTVAVQRADEMSVLHRYRRLIVARRSISDLAGRPLTFCDVARGVVAFNRGDISFILNASDAPIAVDGTVLYRSQTGTAGLLGVDEAMILTPNP